MGAAGACGQPLKTLKAGPGRREGEERGRRENKERGRREEEERGPVEQQMTIVSLV